LTFQNASNTIPEKSDVDTAIADCTEAIRLDPDNADVYYNHALAYYSKDNYAGALADCRTALCLEPGNAAV
jgi:tetratricopeptide (TPR) repeat protein